MKASLLRLLAISLFCTVSSYLLPDGKVRRFAVPLLSLTVTAAVFVPCLSLFRGGGEKLADIMPEAEAAFSAVSYETAVGNEYARRIEASIEEFGEADAEVFLGENFSIDRIVLSGDVTSRMIAYITMELEVPRSYVEIR